MYLFKNPTTGFVGGSAMCPHSCSPFLSPVSFLKRRKQVKQTHCRVGRGVLGWGEGRQGSIVTPPAAKMVNVHCPSPQ